MVVAQPSASVLYVGINSCWVAVAWAASRYCAITAILSTHILVVVWYQLPILDGIANDEDGWPARE